MSSRNHRSAITAYTAIKKTVSSKPVSGRHGQIQKMHYYTTPGVEDQTKSENFTYDSLGRLSAAQTGVVNSTSGAKTWSLQWTYDRLGNRLTQSMLAGDPTLPVSQPNFTIDSATNRITNTGYAYDAAGNMTHDASVAYAYDGANRLININTTSAIYSYFGPQRIKKVLGSTTTRYIYSGSKPIAEYTGTTSPTLSAEYIYAGSRLLVTIAEAQPHIIIQIISLIGRRPILLEPAREHLDICPTATLSMRLRRLINGNSLATNAIPEQAKLASITLISATTHPAKAGS